MVQNPSIFRLPVRTWRRDYLRISLQRAHPHCCAWRICSTRPPTFLLHDGAQEHHVALVTMFEILGVAGRADLKMDLIQELERQRQTLLAFRNNPDISGRGALRRPL